MSPSSKIYEITLRPLGTFFFGGEVVFGELSEGESRRRSYLVRSRPLPQQTSLLGMLREQLLRQNGELLPPQASKAQVDKAIARVGESGFGRELLDGGTSSDYGQIKEISPLKMVYGDQLLEVAPLDDLLGTNGACDYDQDSASPYLTGFDAKKGLFHGFQDTTGSLRVSTDELFAEESRVGITVTNRNNWRVKAKDKEAFYRQTSYRNAHSALQPAAGYGKAAAPERTPEVALRFWAKLTTPLQSAIVKLGGESSTFSMEVEEQTSKTTWAEDFSGVTYQYPKTSPPGYERITLLSDAYLDSEDLRSNNVFAVATTTPFRFFCTLLGTTTNFYDVGDRKTKSLRRQSGGYRLLQRGSVLYVPSGNAPAVKAQLLAQKAFRTIGYNYFA